MSARWDKEPYNGHWNLWLKGLDDVLREIKEIDKASGRSRMNYINKHDPNRGFSQEELESMR